MQNPFDTYAATANTGHSGDAAERSGPPSRKRSMADFDSVTSQETRAPTFKRRMTDADAAEATSFGQQHSAEHEAEMHAFAMDERFRLRQLNIPAYSVSSSGSMAGMDSSAFPSPAISTFSHPDSYTFSQMGDNDGMDVEDNSTSQMLAVGQNDLAGYESFLANQMTLSESNHGQPHNAQAFQTQNAPNEQYHLAAMQQYEQQQQQYQMQQQLHMQQQQQAQHPLAPPMAQGYDPYNGTQVDEYDEAISGRYTGPGGDHYAARLEGMIGHA